MKLNLKQEDFKFILIGFLPALVLYVVYLLGNISFGGYLF